MAEEKEKLVDVITDFLKRQADEVDREAKAMEFVNKNMDFLIQEFLAEEQQELAAKEDTLLANVGSVVWEVASSFNADFFEWVSSIAARNRIEVPPLLQAQMARSYSAPRSETVSKNSTNVQVLGGNPNWLLWPPIASSSGLNIWEIYLDWFGDDPAPKDTPQIRLLVDGAVVDNLVVDDEDEGRIIFEVECNKPIAFELAETENGELAINLETKSK